MSGRVLLIEDEKSLVLSLCDRLRSEGYEVDTARDGQSGYELALRERFDMILLDIRLPRRSGFDVCRDLRQQHVSVPILMLTARGQVADRVVGLKLGADDYLVKPFEPTELLARIEALLRRSSLRSWTVNSSVYEFGEIRVNRTLDEVSRCSEPLTLLPLEYRLLCYFIQHRRQTLSRDRLLDEVWGYDAMPLTRTVDVHVAGLRQKIESDPRHPRYLLTVHRRGYKFVG